MTEMIARVQAMTGAIGDSLDKFGGLLRCENCGRERAMQRGGAGYYTSKGWPTCCGYTMRWWTQQQIITGEMPAEVTGKP